MKLISVATSKTKEVVYFGLSLDVPINTHWLAVDKLGYLYAYTDRYNKPRTSDHYWYDRDKTAIIIAVVELEGMDWKDTLAEF